MYFYQFILIHILYYTNIIHNTDRTGHTCSYIFIWCYVRKTVQMLLGSTNESATYSQFLALASWLMCDNVSHKSNGISSAAFVYITHIKYIVHHVDGIDRSNSVSRPFQLFQQTNNNKMKQVCTTLWVCNDAMVPFGCIGIGKRILYIYALEKYL